MAEMAASFCSCVISCKGGRRERAKYVASGSERARGREREHADSPFFESQLELTHTAGPLSCGRSVPVSFSDAAERSLVVGGSWCSCSLA